MNHLLDQWRRLGSTWRGFSDTPIHREHDAVILTQFRGRDRYYEVFTYGENFGNYQRLDEAKAALERIYGPLQWKQIQMPEVEVVHYYFGPTTEFTDPLTVYVVDKLPRLGKLSVEANLDEVREKYESHAPDSYGSWACFSVAPAIQQRWGYPAVEGFYAPEGDVQRAIDTERLYAHWWNVLPDGRILDATAGQWYRRDYNVVDVLPANDPHYITWDEIPSNREDEVRDMIQWTVYQG